MTEHVDQIIADWRTAVARATDAAEARLRVVAEQQPQQHVVIGPTLYQPKQVLAITSGLSRTKFYHLCKEHIANVTPGGFAHWRGGKDGKASRCAIDLRLFVEFLATHPDLGRIETKKLPAGLL